MAAKTKIVFLYTEIAGYFISCLKELNKSETVELHLVRWPVNKEAPFDFVIPDSINVYVRNNYNDEQLIHLIDSIQPDCIFCSGWVDKAYKASCKKYVNSIPVIVGIDNQWEGTMRQRLAGLLRRVLIKPYFNRAWVAGESQKKLARKLGFADQHILEGLYSADVSYFSKLYADNFVDKSKHFPKRFIYVGRYLQHKGIFPMWEAFIELQNELPNEWELWCLGTGDAFDQRIEHEKIKHFGFVQPEKINEFIKDSGVFILPSFIEPWGVVVHEFAACGFPLLLSPSVGSASVFLNEGENGYFIEAGHVESIKQAFKKIVKLDQKQLLAMSEKSHELSGKLSPTVWTNALLSCITNYKK